MQPLDTLNLPLVSLTYGEALTIILVLTVAGYALQLTVWRDILFRVPRKNSLTSVQRYLKAERYRAILSFRILMKVAYLGRAMLLCLLVTVRLYPQIIQVP